MGAATLPSEQWAYAKGTRVAPAGRALSPEALGDLAREAIAEGRFDTSRRPPHPREAEGVVNAVIGNPRFDTGEGRLLFRGLSPDAETHLPLGQRAVRTLKSAGKGLLKGLTPAALLEGALLAGPISGLAGGAGYASAAPESAGLFTPPGPGYEGLVTPEDIEAAAEARELLKEQERQRLLEQYRASGYDLDPNTRLRDLR
jgi:hypothetical protein